MKNKESSIRKETAGVEKREKLGDEREKLGDEVKRREIEPLANKPKTKLRIDRCTAPPVGEN